MRRFAVISILLFAGLPVFAQYNYGCIDSFSISPGFPCQPEFRPVCGCNNVTYRNLCEAQLRNGVQTYTDGSCSGYEIDIIPTFSRDFLTFTIVQAVPKFSRMFIFDTFGRLWYQQEIAAADWFSFSLDIEYMEIGAYIMYVYDSNGTVRIKRFVKLP